MSTGGAQAFKVLLQILSVVVLSRLLPPSEFGLMGMISPLVGFVMLFGDLGLTQAVVTARVINDRQLSTIFWVNGAFAAVLATILGCTAPLIAHFYGEPRLVAPIQVLAAMIMLSALGVQHQALITRAMRFSRLAVIEVVAAALGFVAAVVIGAIWHSVWALVASAVVTTVCTLAGVWSGSTWRPHRHFNLGEVSSLLHFGKGMLGFNLTNFLSRNLDNVLIGRYVGAVQLGYYDRGYKLLLFPLTQINNPVGRVVVPILSRLVDQPDRYRSMYLRTLQQLLLFTLPGIVFMLTNANAAIPVVLGERWTPSVPIFLWLGLAALHQPISATTGWLFISQSRTTEFGYWGLVVATTSIAAFVAGLPWGAVGVAAAYALSDLLIRAPIVWYWVGRSGPVRTSDLMKLAWPNVVANAVMAATQLAMRDMRLTTLPLVDLVVRLLLAFAVCWGVLCVFRQGRSALVDLKDTIRRVVAPRTASPVLRPSD